MSCEALFRKFSAGLLFGGKIRLNADVFLRKNCPRTFDENDIVFQFEYFILKLFVMKIVHAWMRKRMETVFDYKFGVSSGFCPPNFAFFLHLAG